MGQPRSGKTAARLVTGLRTEIALLADLADRSLRGEPLSVEEISRQREDRIARLHHLGHTLNEEAGA